MAQPPPYNSNKTYPQQGYYQAPVPVQPGTHQTIIVNQPPTTVYVPVNHRSSASQAAGFVGGIIGSAVRSGAQLVGDVAKETSRELDRYAVTPLLDCFQAGCVVQLRSKCSGGCLKIHPNGGVDCSGSLGNDYASHLFVASRFENKVTLRSAVNQTFHLAMANGMAMGTGIGDQASMFRLHESFNHYVTMQHTMTGHYLGVDKQGQIVPPIYLNQSKDEAKFEVHLVYSPFGHRYTPTH